MRVNRNGIVFYGTRGFGQKHREGDESKRLPKLRNFKPDEQGDEAATRGGEESANGALLTIIPQGSQLGGEIEDGTKNGKTEQTHSHVSIRRSFEMQIDDDGAIERERTEEGVLHLQVPRLDGAAKSRDDEHHRGESERRPIVREKRPGRRRGSERAEIGMYDEQRTIGRILKKSFPSRSNAERIEIEDHGAQAKEHTRIEYDIFFCEAQIEEVAEVNANKMQADEQARQQTKTAENDFFNDDSGRQEGLRAHKPEDGHVISGVVERNGGEHQRRANHAQDDECGAAAFRNGQLGKAEFECPNEQESKVSEFRLDGLKLHDAEEQEDV